MHLYLKHFHVVGSGSSRPYLFPLVAFLWREGRGDCTGISFIDSTPAWVCKNKRDQKKRGLQGLARRATLLLGRDVLRN